jgi:hypothetical protein
VLNGVSSSLLFSFLFEMCMFFDQCWFLHFWFRWTGSVGVFQMFNSFFHQFFVHSPVKITTKGRTKNTFQ